MRNFNCSINRTIQADTEEDALELFKDLDEAIKVRKAAEIKYEYHPNHGSIRTL